MLKLFTHKTYFKKRAHGFTIIETMIAVALFVIVVMTGMDALLNANVIHQRSQDMRSVLDSVNFMMEDMSRNMRTGYNFHCVNDGNFTQSVLLVPKSCANGGAIAFEYAYGNEGDPQDQWVYKVESLDGGVTYNLSKSTDSGVNWVQLNPPEVNMSALSGFTVFGAEPLSSSDTQQPLVTIRLLGQVKMKNGSISPFSLQTTASQRLVDIPSSTLVAYQYVRWEIVKRRGGDNSIQAAEFVLTQNGTPLAWPGGTAASNPGGQNPISPSDERPYKAIDGNSTATSKWLDLRFNFNNNVALTGNSKLDINMGTGNKLLFNGYRWATANDLPTRDPISWNLYGSNDGVAWTLLDTRVDQTITTTRNVYTSTFNLP